MIAINCNKCGFLILTKEQYRKQKQDIEEMWYCPKCKSTANMINVVDSIFNQGCLNCKGMLEVEIIFNEFHYGFFCSKLCEGIYLEKFQKDQAKRIKKENV